MAPDIQVPILTGMGNARNCINVLSSHAVVACPGGAGTLSEIALAIKTRRPVVLLRFDPGALFQDDIRNGYVTPATSVEQAMAALEGIYQRWQSEK
jgi:uncharacterized protein (TIGR00725 family)